MAKSSDDDSWPFLTSDMFGITNSSEYRDKIIHFAASYKNILEGWDAWNIKLESLLKEISFESVKILIEDCYQGDFIAIWEWQSNNGEREMVKTLKKLEYDKSPDITLG